LLGDFSMSAGFLAISLFLPKLARGWRGFFF
jgi:hypothetical protein